MIIFVGGIWSSNHAYAQTSNNNQDIPGDSNKLIMKYCKQYADSVSKGINVIQDLIGVGILPNSYYGKTCPEQTNN